MLPVTYRTADSLQLPLAAAPTPAFSNDPHDIQTMPPFSSSLSQERPVPLAGPRQVRTLQASSTPFLPSQGMSQELAGFFKTVLWKASTKAMKFPAFRVRRFLNQAVTWLLLLLNWFLGFSQSYFGPYIVLYSVFPWRTEDL